MQSAKFSPGAYELTFIKNGYVREDVEFTVSDKAVALENIAPVCGDIRGEAEAELCIFPLSSIKYHNERELLYLYSVI